MKNLSLIIASLLLFSGVSFACPKQATQQSTSSKETKKTEKKAMTNMKDSKKEVKKTDTKASVNK